MATGEQPLTRTASLRTGIDHGALTPVNERLPMPNPWTKAWRDIEDRMREPRPDIIQSQSIPQLPPQPREQVEFVWQGRTYRAVRCGDVHGEVNSIEVEALINHFALNSSLTKAVQQPNGVEVEVTPGNIDVARRTFDLRSAPPVREKATQRKPRRRLRRQQTHNPLLDPSYDIYYAPRASDPRPDRI